MVQFYTLEEVKLRNGQNGARTWIVIHDCVYDATEFLPDVRKFNSTLMFGHKTVTKNKSNAEKPLIFFLVV